MLRRRIEKLLCFFDRVVPTRDQQSSDQRLDVQLRRELFHRFVVMLLNCPSFLHRNADTLVRTEGRFGPNTTIDNKCSKISRTTSPEEPAIADKSVRVPLIHHRTYHSLPQQNKDDRAENNSINNKDGGRIPFKVSEQSPYREIPDDAGDDCRDDERREAFGGEYLDGFS